MGRELWARPTRLVSEPIKHVGQADMRTRSITEVFWGLCNLLHFYLVKYNGHALYLFQVYSTVTWHLGNLHCDQRTQSSSHLSPRELVALLLTLFPVTSSPIRHPIPLVTVSSVSVPISLSLLGSVWFIVFRLGGIFFFDSTYR